MLQCARSEMVCHDVSVMISTKALGQAKMPADLWDSCILKPVSHWQPLTSMQYMHSMPG